MKTDRPDTTERLIRVSANRRGTPVELRVHYAITRNDGFDTIELFLVEDAD